MIITRSKFDLFSDEEEAERRKRKNDMLKMYYGSMEGGGEQNLPLDPLDINGATFKADAYLGKLLKVRDVCHCGEISGPHPRMFFLF